MPMFSIATTNRFEKDVARCYKRGLDIDKMETLIECLENTGTVLLKPYRPHTLTGKFLGHWECHIKPDWLLLWLRDDDQKTITLIGTGTHSDLFK